jgi:hypothetical protein
MIFLEHDTNAIPSQPRPVSLGLHRPSFPRYSPAGRVIDAAQKVEEAAFAASACSDDGDAIANLYLQIDVPDRGYRTAVIETRDAAQRD